MYLVYRLSLFLIMRLISWVIQGRDDFPRINLDGMHSSQRLFRVFVKSFHNSSTDFPRLSRRKDS